MRWEGRVADAVGRLMSAFWILSANSWMQTPVGDEMRDGIAYPVDRLDIVFNPSFPYRVAHMVISASRRKRPQDRAALIRGRYIHRVFDVARFR